MQLCQNFGISVVFENPKPPLGTPLLLYYTALFLPYLTKFLLPCKQSTRKSKGVPRQTEVALGVPGRLSPRIFSTLGTTRVVGRQPNTPTSFTPEEIPDTHFQRLSRPQGTWFCWKEPRKKSQVTPPGIDPGTVRLVAQRLNHYDTPRPLDYLQ